MAYGLKYTAEFRNTRSLDYRLEVYERDYAGDSKKIGALAGCALEIPGNMGDVISPLVKTNLRFSVVDVTSRNDTATTKWHDWSEFFTPDSTLYKVVLSELNGSTPTAIWSGYVTPDSWLEQLSYQGSITITARDNIGHLKDFPFVADGAITPDENGLIEVRWIMYRAMQIIEFPMDWWMENEGHGQYAPEVPESENSDYLTESCVNAELFDGMDWYEVLEQTLEAIGFVYRYVGRNLCVFECLRNMPKMGHYTEATDSQTMEFYGGTLELDPAIKKIEEEQDYKHKSEVTMEHMKGLQFGTTTTYRCKTDGNTMPAGGTHYIPEHDADMNLVTGAGQTGWDVGSGMLDPSLYLPDDFVRRAEGEDGWRNYAFIACNQVLNAQGTSPTATFRFRTMTSAVKLTFRFTPNPMTIEYQGSSAGKMDGTAHYSLSEIKYYVMYSDGTTTRCWNGAQWVNNAYLLEKTYDAQNQYETELSFEMSECDEITDGTLVVEFGQIIYKMWFAGGHGCYARLAEIKAEIKGTTALQSNKVTTINNSDYNVMLTRKPLFGALSREMGFVKPANYLAGLFYIPVIGANPVLFPYMVKFTDQGGSSLVPLPVLIHQQILCYYFGAARVLSGNCAPVSKGRFAFDKLCVYKGHTYLLQGGTMDFFSGIMSGAVLREFVDFSTLWSGGAPSYSEDVIYNG